MATQCRSTGVQRPTDILLLMSNRHTHSCRHCRHLPTHRTIVHDTWMWMWFDALSAFAYRAIGASQPTTLRSAAFYVSFSSTLCPLPCTLESCLMSFGLTNININGRVCVLVLLLDLYDFSNRIKRAHNWAECVRHYHYFHYFVALRLVSRVPRFTRE